GYDRFEFRISADEVGARKHVLQIVRERLRIVAEEYGADAAVALCDEDRAQRAFADREADVDVLAPGAVAARRHAEDGVRLFVKARIRTVAGVVDRLRHAVAAGELLPQAPVAMRRRICFGSQAGDAAKQAMKMVTAQP